MNFKDILANFPVQQSPEIPYRPEEDGAMDIPTQAGNPAQPEMAQKAPVIAPMQDNTTAPEAVAPQTGAAPVVTNPSILDQYQELLKRRGTDIEDAKRKQFYRDLLSGVNDNIGLIVGGAQAMNTGAVVNAPKVAGIKDRDFLGQVDQQYKPELENTLAQYKAALEAQKEAAAQQRQDYWKQKDYDLKTKYYQKALQDQENKLGELQLTPGEEATDKDFAKKANEWRTMGAGHLDTNLGRLQSAISDLEGKKDEFNIIPRSIKGTLPDLLQSEGDIQIRDKVRSAAQESLRAILGSQYTEKEGTDIMNRAYDPRLSPDANIERIKITAEELKKRKQAMNSQTGYFEQQGTLKGFSGNSSPEAQTKVINGATYQKVDGGWQKIK